jgi:hypothetical protein
VFGQSKFWTRQNGIGTALHGREQAVNVGADHYRSECAAHFLLHGIKITTFVGAG